MTSTLLLGVLAWFHIFSAIGWFGGDLMLLVGMEPMLGKLAPATRREFMTTVFPRLYRLDALFSTSTVLFGLLFAYEYTGGDLSMLSPSTSWGLAITVGATLGLLAFLLEVLVDFPSERKVIAIMKTMSADGAAPADLTRYQRRGEFAEIAVVVLLFAALVFMVAAGQI